MVGLRHRNSGGKLPTIAKFAFGSRFYSVNRESLASILLKQSLERSPSRTAPQKQFLIETVWRLLWANAKWTSVCRVIPSHFTSKELLLRDQNHVTHQRITLMHFTLFLAKSKIYMKHHSNWHWIDTATIIFMIPQNLQKGEQYYRNFRPLTCTADYPHRSIFAVARKKFQQITRTGR